MFTVGVIRVTAGRDDAVRPRGRRRTGAPPSSVCRPGSLAHGLDEDRLVGVHEGRREAHALEDRSGQDDAPAVVAEPRRGDEAGRPGADDPRAHPVSLPGVQAAQTDPALEREGPPLEDGELVEGRGAVTGGDPVEASAAVADLLSDDPPGEQEPALPPCRR